MRPEGGAWRRAREADSGCLRAESEFE